MDKETLDSSANTQPSGSGVSRRNFITTGAVAGAALAVPMSWAALAQSTAPGAARSTMKSVTFNHGNIAMAGNLHLPEGFSETRRYPAILSIHPGGGVKEQTAGLYAQRLAEQGFVTLAFDASHQGASGGEPRFLDDPMKRVADSYSAVDYLVSLPYIDAARIGILGVCAGSGTAIKAASTERRIKAVATVSAVDVGAATRRGWDGKGPVAVGPASGLAHVSCRPLHHSHAIAVRSHPSFATRALNSTESSTASSRTS